MVRSTALIAVASSLPLQEVPSASKGESEQDNRITSSAEMNLLEGGSSSSASDANEQEFNSVIDLLEEKVNAEESAVGNEAGVSGQNGAGQGQPHSVEYWSVSKHGKPKTFLRRYHASNRHSRNFRQSNRRMANNQLMASSTGMHESDLYGGVTQQQIFNANFLPTAPQFQPLANPLFLQMPSPMHVYPAPSMPPPPLPSIQIFIPPEQQGWNPPPAVASQFIPFPPVSHFASQPLFSFSQQQQYGGVTYYGGSLVQNGFPLTVPSTPAPVSYYQGAPLFYQIPTQPSTMNPLAQPFLSDCSYLGGYERLLEYPPPPYEDAILTSSSGMPMNELIPEQVTEMEVDSGDHGVDEPVQEKPWESGYLTPVDSPAATPSASDTNLSEMDRIEVASGVTSGYSSCTSSPLAGAVASQINPEAHESGVENVKVSTADGSVSSVDDLSVGGQDPETTEVRPEQNVEAFPRPGLERFSMELHALNNACINTMMQETVYGGPGPIHQQNLMVYPGESSILIYSQNDGNRSVILYNEQEIPYVGNVFDFRVQASFKEQCGPALSYPYYVPPRTADNDFFGGQFPIWQLKMGQYFLKYQPHNWKMHGVPETFNTEMFLARVMDTLGEFHIVSKLRFSCRTCKIPWTSKKGTIVFKFCFNSAFQQGWILMRIFGQICMREECQDYTFQNPACYPEEIDRVSVKYTILAHMSAKMAMKKLSEYVGNQCYGIAVNPSCFDECFKSIRRSGNVGNNHSGSTERKRANLPTPHKKEFCQACMNGVCKNIFAKPFLAASKP